MQRRYMIAAFISLLATPGLGQSVKLSGDDIRTLLTGNTAIGRWEGQNYRQYFGADGVTIYSQDGAKSTRGEWRVDDEVQEYQSIWPNDADWEGWFVMEFSGNYYWVSKKTPPTPFRVENGQRLVPE
ncbi:MAG: hypothetical protein AAF754_00390 [Pseudomonadota bacterium]